MGTWMNGLGFTAPQIGTAFGATSVAAMISPFIVGPLADRFFSAQRVLGVLHLLGGLLLFAASKTTTFAGFYGLLIAHTLCYMPTLALVNTVAFSQMKDAAQSFGSIRVMGTFGWIAAGYLIGTRHLGASSTQFVIGAAVSIFLGIYSFLFLPDVPPKAKGEPVNFRAIIGLDAMALFKDPSFAVFAIGSFLICIPLAFYYSGAERFLTQTGVLEAPWKMTFGQMSEVLFMLIFPIMFSRLGVKKMLVLGMACWLARYLCFAYGAPEGTGFWLLMLGIVLHGPCFDFFFVTGQIYVDQCAPVQIRSAAQCLIAFITYGAGMLVGSITQGYVLKAYTLPDNSINWSPTWIIPAVGSGVIMLAFLALFKSPGKVEAHDKVEAQ